MSRRHLTEGLGRGNRSRLDPAAATGQLEGDLMLTVDVMGGRTCVRTVDVFSFNSTYCHMCCSVLGYVYHSFLKQFERNATIDNRQEL